MEQNLRDINNIFMKELHLNVINVSIRLHSRDILTDSYNKFMKELGIDGTGRNISLFYIVKDRVTYVMLA